MSKYAITNQRDLRDSFWNNNSDLQGYQGYTQNDYDADTRMRWCDFIDTMARTGVISEALANRATL